MSKLHISYGWVGHLARMATGETPVPPEGNSSVCSCARPEAPPRPQPARRRIGRRRLPAAGLALLLFACLPVMADEGDDPKEKPAPDAGQMRPTEIGVRFTPKMARAVSKAFLRQMKDRYGLDAEQTEAIDKIVSTQLMGFVRENAEIGRDLIETMLETAIEHDGRFPKETAQEFGKLAKPLFPALKAFFAESAGKIGRKMTLKQRLKFTGDMTAATAGLVVFENRMKRWEEGKVGDNANPFWDPADRDEPEGETDPDDPNEHPDHRRARKNAERRMQWQIDTDERWENYVKRAAEYYDFNESQQTAAHAILKDCLDRAHRIKTPEWRATVLDNRIAALLSRPLGPEINQGPWMFALNAEYERLRKPLGDLEQALKRRIEDLPDSQQRAAAKETVRKVLARKGIKKLPL